MALTVEHIVVLKLFNGLGSSFNTYLTILNEQARREDKFPALDDLLKNLEDEEARMRQDPVAVANMLKAKGRRTPPNRVRPNANAVVIITPENAGIATLHVGSVVRLVIWNAFMKAKKVMKPQNPK